MRISTSIHQIVQSDADVEHSVSGDTDENRNGKSIPRFYLFPLRYRSFDCSLSYTAYVSSESIIPHSYSMAVCTLILVRFSY